MTEEQHSTDAQATHRWALLAAFVAVGVLGIKLGAWQITGSTALFADAAETIVNVLAGFFALWAIGLSRQPPDSDHPYGHGKAEFLSAAFEGGLVLFAGVMILIESARQLAAGVTLQRLDTGFALAVVAAIINLTLGGMLAAVARRTGSPTLRASSRHLLTDVWTTAGAVVGLALAWWLDLPWLDPAVALGVAALILREGYKIVRGGFAGLMDEADPEDLRRIEAVLQETDAPGFAGWDRLRSRHQGRWHMVDVRLKLSPAMSVAEADHICRDVELRIGQALPTWEVLCVVEADSSGRRNITS